MKVSRTLIESIVREYLDENVNLESFPKDVLKTLDNEYGQYFKHNFDWNSKQDEFVKDGVFDGKGFQQWIKQNNNDELLKNLDKLIQKTRQDLILLKRREIADKALSDFEELIIPVLGNEVLVEPLTKYMADVLLYVGMMDTDINIIKTKMEQAFKEANNIIDSDGNIDHDKITPSELFVGDSISYPRFESFAKKNPEYNPVFQDWEKIFNYAMELSSVELNAYRSSTPYGDIKNLYKYLTNIRKTLK